MLAFRSIVVTNKAVINGKTLFHSSKILSRRSSGGNQKLTFRKLRSSLEAKKGSMKNTKNEIPPKEKKSLWNSAEFWGGCGALAGWGMSGAAIYDASQSGAEIISLNMTGVLLVYSSLFARWACIVKPQNLLLCSCHIANIFAQANQMRRALEFKMECGENKQVQDIVMKAVGAVATGIGCFFFGPMVQNGLSQANLGIVSSIAAADAGPFTVHFWAPMSKWLISGASFVDLNRPTDKISIAQYTALTLTGFFFTRYSLLVTPINYTLCSVNVALFGSSAWHLGRKVNADYIITKDKDEKK